MTSLPASREHRQDVRAPACALASAVAISVAGVPLGGPAATGLACFAILILGLPHGALDLALIRREGTRGPRGLVPLIALYLACAAATWAVWRIAPIAALGLFLAIATAHFAEDWAETGSSLLSFTLAGSLLAAPALLHRLALRQIFAALTGREEAAVVADLLLLMAPTAFVGALAGLYALVRAGRGDLAAVAALSLAGLIALPPAVGFVFFFGLCHSPRHFGEALRTLSRRRLRQWGPIALPTTLGALAIGVLLYRQAPLGAPDMKLASATFMLLSVLTTPHMLTPLLSRGRWMHRGSPRRAEATA